jgi:TolB-like protein
VSIRREIRKGRGLGRRGIAVEREIGVAGRAGREPPMLKARILGPFEVCTQDGKPVTVSSRKGQALLAILALSPKAVATRERISSLLWSDRGEEQAQGSLRQLLVALRKDLSVCGEDVLTSAGFQVALNRSAMEIDAIELRSLARSGDLEDLRRAAALYRGELLADAGIRDAGFTDWLRDARETLRNVAVGVLEKLCTEEIGEPRRAAADRLLALDPARETAHRALMKIFTAAGEAPLALRQYELCRRALERELQARPGQKTEALRQSIIEASRETAAAAPPQPPTMSAGQAAREADPPARLLDGTQDVPSIAVLPFDPMSRTDELEALADGLTEDITSALVRIQALKVVARNTAFRFKGHAVDIREVGRQLDADYVIEGSVRMRGSRIRVTAQLIEAASGHHIWADRIDQPQQEVHDHLDEVTASIVASVQTQIILNEGRLAAVQDGTTSRPARLLARSWEQLLMLNVDSLATSLALAERAFSTGGSQPVANRMIAAALYHQAYMGYRPWNAELVEKIHAHARAAIAADRADEYCHWAMEMAHLMRKEHDRAMASLRRALEINPSCSIAIGSMGTVLAWQGKCEESVQQNERALRLNPQDPSAFYRHFGLALAHYLAGRYAAAYEHVGVTVQTRPDWWLAQLVATAALGKLGHSDEAARMLDMLRRTRPNINAHELEMLPFATLRDREHLCDGLRLAGLGVTAEIG